MRHPVSLSRAASATPIDAEMPDRGEAGGMVFAPAFARAGSSGKIRVAATGKGPDAPGIHGMPPAGRAAVVGAPGRKVEPDVTGAGVSSAKGPPPVARGMAPPGIGAPALHGRGRTAGLFEDLLAQVVQ